MTELEKNKNKSQEKLLEITNLGKSFDGKKVLEDISLTVNRGEVISIIGPSGSGKTPLLRCATFLEAMDSGELSYCGKKVVTTKNGKAVYPGKAEMKEAKSKFSLVFQSFNLFPHFNVLKNVTDAAIHVMKRDKEEVLTEARQILKKVGLEEKLNAYPCELSGGQQQRVAIARALVMNPEILYFDEPTSALDPEITAGILRIMRELAEEKMTMVIVIHEIDFARAVSDRVIFMDGGYIIEQGAPKDVIDNPSNERTKAFLRKLSV